MNERVWACKIGGLCNLPDGADQPIRKAVTAAFYQITGFEPAFVFSGWGASLDEDERAVVENRDPSEEHARQWRSLMEYAKALDAADPGAAALLKRLLTRDQ